MIESAQIALPFISVVVLTYNSVATIQETLDSLARQDYPLLEVLVCDDGSTDATPKIVKAWLEQNGHIFKRAEMLQSPANEGICKNVQKGYSAARGDWIKPIAGDDLFELHALRKFAAVAASSDFDVIVSMVKIFGEGSKDGDVLPNSEDLELIVGSADRLRLALMNSNFIPAPGVFLRRAAYESVGGIDGAFKHLDDWPLWVRFVDAGKSFGVLREALVQYRVSTESISKRRLTTEINKDFLQDHVTMYENYQRKSLSHVQHWDRAIAIFRLRLAMGPLRSYPNLYKATFLLKMLSPVYWVKLVQQLR